MQRRIGHCIWAELLQPAAGFIARQPALGRIWRVCSDRLCQSLVLAVGIDSLRRLKEHAPIEERTSRGNLVER
jgi:hypothetical protein